ncbi:MAG: DUF1947 domain-containing protein, partial [Candidatus Bathyarchaeia archaeon]
RDREKKVFLAHFSETLGLNAERLFGPKPEIEVIEMQNREIYIINDVPLLFRIGEEMVPTLFFNEMISLLPKITVNMGAVPYVCNGADVMAPGIVKIKGDFKDKSLVVVLDEKHEKTIAICRSLFDSKTIGMLKQGKALKNLHYVGDEIWKLIKNLAKN